MADDGAAMHLTWAASVTATDCTLTNNVTATGAAIQTSEHEGELVFTRVSVGGNAARDAWFADGYAEIRAEGCPWPAVRHGDDTYDCSGAGAFTCDRNGCE